MKLRYRLLLAIALTLGCMVSGMYVVSSRVVIASYLDLEQQAADRDVDRVKRALDQMVAELHVKSVDWAAWDDTYRFMKDRNRAYIESNMVDVSIVNMQLDMMMFVSQDRHIWYSKPVERFKGVAPPVPAHVLTALSRSGFLKDIAPASKGRSGFILQDGGPMMVSIRPILTTAGTGSNGGWIVFCRNVNEQLVQRLEDITRLKLKAYLVNDPGLPQDCKNAITHLNELNPRFIQPTSRQIVAGYTMIRDIHGNPTFLVKMDKPRAIYQQGLASVAYMARMILIAGFLFSIVTLIVLERGALLRLSRLSNQVESIGDETRGVRVFLPGKDELTLLATKINEMLQKLERRTIEIAAKNNVLENAVEGICQLDNEGRITSANLSFARMLGYAPEELIGKPWSLTVYGSNHGEMQGLIDRAHETGRAEGEVQGVRKDGSLSFNEITIIKSLDGEDVQSGLHFFVKDISERKRLESDIEFQAFHDKLTGLPNRALFLDRVSKAIVRATRNSLGVAVLFVDLDNFKLVNDNFGHAAGDQMLQIIAERLKSAVRDVDTVARLGGDEFTILLEDLTSVDESVEVCQRVLENLNPAISLSGAEAFARGSIGISYSADTSVSVEKLINNADRAMYMAKSNGKAGFVVHDQSMDDEAVVRIDLETALSKAIDNSEIYLEYQPIVDLTTGSFVGAEALARWNHPKRGLIPPTQFIQIAEQCGLIIPIGFWILEEACRQMKAWHGELGTDTLAINVNISGKQLQRPDLIERVASILHSTGLPPRCLKLEITESVLIANRTQVGAKLMELKKQGVLLALDDFGTGFSSLSTLGSFPVDTIKIDRSFVSRLEEGGDTRAIVEAIMAMSRSLKFDVTGEGIETGFQMLTLKEMGCKTGQGYLFDIPLSASTFGHRLVEGGTAEALEFKRRQLLEIQEMFNRGASLDQDPAA